MDTRHEADVCKVCAAKIEEQARIDRKLASFKTLPAKIEFLLRELRTQKSMDSEGRIRSLNKPPAARGRNAKNIARILRVGKSRMTEAKARGVDFSVLPPESKIRKRVEADWNRRINPPKPKLKGQAGREAAKQKGTTTLHKISRREFAVSLRGGQPDLTRAQIAEKITKRFKLKEPLSERSVRRYLTGR